MLRENSDNVHLYILVSQVLLILFSKECEWENREEQINHVIEFAAHFPSWNLSWVSLRLEVISSSVKPMSVSINVKFIEVSELVERVMFQIMILDLVIFSNFRFVFKSSLVWDGNTLIVSRLRLSLHRSSAKHLSVSDSSS